MPELRHVFRAARRLHEIYAKRTAQAVQHKLTEKLNPYECAMPRLRKLVQDAFAGAERVNRFLVRRQLRMLFNEMQAGAKRLLRALRRSKPEIPSLRSLMDELRQLEDEFGDFEVDLRNNFLAARTESIVLEGIYLGPFTILLEWSQLLHDDKVDAFDIRAESPNQAACNDGVTHPHVKHQKLCAGDATAPIALALKQGRLADAFCLIRSVLTNYNSSSAHVPLSEWDGRDCAECGCSLYSDEGSRCPDCDNEFCSDCLSDCGGCRQSHCSECLGQCPKCSEYFCSDCLNSPKTNESQCCQRCCQQSVTEKPGSGVERQDAAANQVEPTKSESTDSVAPEDSAGRRRIAWTTLMRRPLPFHTFLGERP